jgi:hypothetical protein
MSKFEGDRFIPLRPINSSRFFLSKNNKNIFQQVLGEILLGDEQERGYWWLEGNSEPIISNVPGENRYKGFHEGNGVEEEKKKEGLLKFSKKKQNIGLSIKEVYEKAEKLSKSKRLIFFFF